MDIVERIQNGTVRSGLSGLGYVGLPLAVEFGKVFDTVGFDVKPERLEMLRRGIDTTLETSEEELRAAKHLRYTGEMQELQECDFFIVTVPTPVDKYNRPDLTPLYRASETVGRVMRPGSIVIYESTVYPGCTEEECVPILEKYSNLAFNRDFFCGYSPERINPGDKEHTLTKILKITSGSTPEAADAVDALYRAILKNGTFRASSLKVAEAAKVIENSQRDLNIPYVNELPKIFHLIGIDTGEVLEAAGTKWNFLKFRPGLVGGHCIGVDPYYLTFKAEELGCHPQVILAGRRINDGMGKHVAETCVKLLIRQGRLVNAARVGILGFTFKENVPDLRNTRVIDVIRELQEYGVDVLVHDPLADAGDVRHEYGLSFAALDELANLDALILAVPHKAYAENGVLEPAALHARFAVPDKALLLDVKGCLSPSAVQAEGMAYWRL